MTQHPCHGRSSSSPFYVNELQLHAEMGVAQKPRVWGPHCGRGASEAHPSLAEMSLFGARIEDRPDLPKHLFELFILGIEMG